MVWPDGKRFAFTVFDDPDSQTLTDGEKVYALLHDLGLRTTKAVWPIRGAGIPSDHGGTCGEPAYRAWAERLQVQGFEIAYHNATSHTSGRHDTVRALDAFRSYFGTDPVAMANHYNCEEAVYWGDARVTGMQRTLYNVLTRGKNRGKFVGHVEGHPYFWGDVCRDRIRYVRNFVFADVNTLAACPFMPYHDPQRPFVRAWFAASEGADCASFVARIDEHAQEQLEAEGGLCIMYAHFGHGFVEHGTLNGRFVDLMKRMSLRNGWFVPASVVLDYLASARSSPPLGDRDRRALERRWLWHKVKFGTA